MAPVPAVPAVRTPRGVRSDPEANLYIKNLDDSFTDEKLRASDAPYGLITSAKIERTTGNVSRGFGFVSYSTPAEAAVAIKEMNGRLVGTKPLFVSIHQPKGEREALVKAKIEHAEALKRSILTEPEALVAGVGAGESSLLFFTLSSVLMVDVDC
jgi:polyadenylate-binding protein